MKKAIILMTTMAFSILCFAKNADSTYLPDTAKLTLSKVYSDVKSGIDGLAKSLKVPATHVYNIMIRQQVAQAISNLLFVLVFVILSIIFYKVGMKTWSEIEQTKQEDELVGITIFSFFFCGICSLVTICSFWHDYSDIVTGFTNPEYGAIKEIISFVK